MAVFTIYLLAFRQCSSLHLDIYLYLACQILIGLWGNRFPPPTSARSVAALRIHFRICAENISSEKWTKCPIKFDGWQFVKFVKDLVKPEFSLENTNWNFQSNFTKRSLVQSGLVILRAVFPEFGMTSEINYLSRQTKGFIKECVGWRPDYPTPV